MGEIFSGLRRFIRATRKGGKDRSPPPAADRRVTVNSGVLLSVRIGQIKKAARIPPAAFSYLFILNK